MALNKHAHVLINCFSHSGFFFYTTLIRYIMYIPYLSCLVIQSSWLVCAYQPLPQFLLFIQQSVRTAQFIVTEQHSHTILFMYVKVD